jgi:hypothetical protein
MNRKGFGSQFARFQSMIYWPNCFGPMARWHIMVKVCDKAKPLTSWPGKKREDKKKGRD